MNKSHNTPDCTEHFVKNGKYKGVQRYICRSCKKTYSDSPKKRGGQIKGLAKMSGKLRVKLWRSRKLLNETIHFLQ
jgi:transposase-like protein